MLSIEQLMRPRDIYYTVHRYHVHVACSNVDTVVSHRTGTLYIHIVSKTNRVQVVVSKQEAFVLYKYGWNNDILHLNLLFMPV